MKRACLDNHILRGASRLPEFLPLRPGAEGAKVRHL